MKNFLSSRSRHSRPLRQQSVKARRDKFFRPLLETLEERRMLAIFTVDALVDTIDVSPGDGVAADENGNTSLRAAY